MQQRKKVTVQSWGSLALTLHFQFQQQSHPQLGRLRVGSSKGLVPPRPPPYLVGLLGGTPFWRLSNYSQETQHVPRGLAQVSFSGNQVLLKHHGPSPNYEITFLPSGEDRNIRFPVSTCLCTHTHLIHTMLMDADFTQ